MSYAAVAAENAPPVSEQPHADPALLNTEPPHADNVADDTSKVTVVAPDFKEHPATVTSETAPPPDTMDNFPEMPSSPSRGNKKNRRLQEAEAEGAYLLEVAKRYLLRPGVAGGLVGLVNIGLLAGAARAFYVNPGYRRDTKVLSTTAAATFALLGLEGYGAAWYANTPGGQAEAKKAKEEGTLVYRHAREQILRPGVLGGLLGLVNVGILGGLGYFSYTNWDKPTWDRRLVSAVSVGLLALWGGEGYIAEQYYKDRHSK
ncbi:uncharacterized protein SCHCODRAFT_02618691 [Schizophyllum commune H4-8]|nr:uncharacterized protein SCHCODRAFT_02618691 [Schizophyllum commune H4-8]KAI5895139.1 hypothetical protein SCHCODRAFT_02618691 [Schizophyllum commune H4-8]